MVAGESGAHGPNALWPVEEEKLRELGHVIVQLHNTAVKNARLMSRLALRNKHATRHLVQVSNFDASRIKNLLYFFLKTI